MKLEELKINEKVKLPEWPAHWSVQANQYGYLMIETYNEPCGFYASLKDIKRDDWIKVERISNESNRI